MYDRVQSDNDAVCLVVLVDAAILICAVGSCVLLLLGVDGYEPKVRCCTLSANKCEYSRETT